VGIPIYARICTETERMVFWETKIIGSSLIHKRERAVRPSAPGLGKYRYLVAHHDAASFEGGVRSLIRFWRNILADRDLHCGTTDRACDDRFLSGLYPCEAAAAKRI
jgi:hypothetical protein